MTTQELIDALHDNAEVNPEADAVIDLGVFGMGSRHIIDVHEHEETGSAVLVIGERVML